MKRFAAVFVVGSVVLLLALGDVFARGGRGGGGFGGGGVGGGGFRGGGGGMGGGGGYGGRSPAMSRPAPAARPAGRPAGASAASRPSAGTRPSSGTRPSTGTRPSAGTRPGTGTRPGSGARPSAGTRPGTGAGARPSTSQLQNFLDIGPVGPGTGGRSTGTRVAGSGPAADFLRSSGARPETLPATGARPGAGASTRPGAISPGAAARAARTPGAGNRAGIANRAAAGQLPAGNRPGRIENRQEWRDNRLQRRDEVRDQFNENHPRLDFWSDHPNWAAWRINRPYRWAAWGALTGWVGAGWSEPAAYGYGEDVYYQDDSVYYGDQEVATSEEYAQQAEEIVTSAPEVAPEQADWMPLGVFALTPDGQATGPDSNLYLQLAISKEGVISGTLHNTLADTTQTIEGAVDKQSQRTAWTVAGKTRPLMETGISNLTEDAAPALVHFADGETQQWLMVRLLEPKTQQP